jgi:hypothetical protein
VKIWINYKIYLLSSSFTNILGSIPDLDNIAVLKLLGRVWHYLGTTRLKELISAVACRDTQFTPKHYISPPYINQIYKTKYISNKSLSSLPLLPSLEPIIFVIKIYPLPYFLLPSIKIRPLFPLKIRPVLIEMERSV